MANRLAPKPIPLITWRNMAPPFENHTYFQHHSQVPFQSEPDGFSLVNAWWLSEAALLAYAEEAFAIARFNDAGFDDVRFFSGHATQCYVAANDTSVVVAFRGTECGIDRGPEAMAQFIADLGADIDIHWVDVQGGGKMHRGFHEALDEVWPDLLTGIDALTSANRKLWLTGHSLGGALAVVAASRLNQAPGLYTFGTPRVGNREFVAGFPYAHHSIVNNNDVVPHMPPFPYVDPENPRYIDSGGKLHARIDAWQRWKDGIQGHIKCFMENARHLNQGFSATLPDGLKDHTPLLYALHLWNNLAEKLPPNP